MRTAHTSKFFGWLGIDDRFNTTSRTLTLTGEIDCRLYYTLQNITFVARHVSNGIISIQQLHSTGSRELSAQMELACDQSQFEYFQLV